MLSHGGHEIQSPPDQLQSVIISSCSPSGVKRLHNADEYHEATTVLALTQYDMDLRSAPGIYKVDRHLR